jgi:hypothetical protein
MKVAVCLSGHTRGFQIKSGALQETFIKSIVNNYNADVFIHTWDVEGIGINRKPLNKKNRKKEVLEKIKNNSKYGNAELEFRRDGPTIYEKDFENIPNIKNVIIENYKSVEPEILKICDLINLSKATCTFGNYSPNFVSAQRKIYLCNELKKQQEEINGTYDIVIRTRCDIKDYNFDLPNPVPDNTIYLENSQAYHGLSDIFAFGNSDIMNKYAELYLNIPKYAEENRDFNPHSIIKYHLEEYSKLEVTVVPAACHLA